VCRRFLVLALSVPLLWPAAVRGQALLDPAGPIPNDPAVTVGTLGNGLSYYIRANDLPETRAELRLVIRAGAMQEEDDERGLAHFLEHMAFNGTRNFPPSELVDYLESIGMQFGSDLNASTSFDETIYQLQVPTDDPEILQTAFQILEDWAHGIIFDGEQIEEERGVIVEEWRLRQGVGSRIADQQIPVMFHGSRYAERIPIGELDQIQSFTRDDFLDFYRRWYRPDLMAVIAVGDFDVAGVEALIRQHFEGIATRPEPVASVSTDIPIHPETLFVLSSDPEATSTGVEVDLKRAARKYRTIAERRESLVPAYHRSLLNQRLAELSLRPGAAFLGASTGAPALGRESTLDAMGAAVDNGRVLDGLEAVLREAKRVLDHGFTEAELAREKIKQLRLLERAFAERENRYSGSFVGELMSHFLNGTPFPSLEWEVEVFRSLVPTLSLSEVNRAAPNWFREEGRVILVTSPEREDAPLPSEAELRDVFERVGVESLDPWEEESLDAPLVGVQPTPGRIVSEDRIEDLDVTVWELSNGVRVFVKPTDFREDQVLMGSYSPGGTSLLSDDDFLTVGSVVALIPAGGLGEFTQVDLGKKLAGTAASAAPSVSSTSESVGGSASPQDLETLLQLTYLRFTAPRKDPEIFEVFKDQARTGLENRGASPISDFSDTLTAVMTQNHPRSRVPTPADIDRLDLDRAYDFYLDRFGDAGDFTFAFVGTIDLDELRPLVETWLGGLPSAGRVEAPRDTGVDPPSGVIEKIVRRGLEPTAQTQIIFAGPTEYTREGAAAVSFLGSALEVKLRERLREDLGGTYGVSASGGLTDEPDDEYQLSISFGSDPDRVDELVAAIFEEIDALRAGADISQEVANRKEAARRSHETSIETNNYWVSGLLRTDRLGRDPHELLAIELTESITEEMVIEAANRYLTPDRFVRVTLLPEVGVREAGGSGGRR